MPTDRNPYEPPTLSESEQRRLRLDEARRRRKTRGYLVATGVALLVFLYLQVFKPLFRALRWWLFSDD